ncbi:hypothetical protein TNIN_363591 [Trichonephila inaurata madagascariensis]|uniref:Uncharacterized protein n=1 Tax=Trichonephila inaurata madagascariensis TaxID=2747483 RepID=A0A8X7CPN3_9ARAC|nr:hypothetical protein TNIN_363591 [Trichonephila inaurata madagascariensis]
MEKTRYDYGMHKYTSPTQDPLHRTLYSPANNLKYKKTSRNTLLPLGPQQSLNSLAPFMTTVDPEVTDLFQRLKYYQEELKKPNVSMAPYLLVQRQAALFTESPSSPLNPLKGLPPNNLNLKAKESMRIFKTLSGDKDQKPPLYNNFFPETGKHLINKGKGHHKNTKSIRPKPKTKIPPLKCFTAPTP